MFYNEFSTVVAFFDLFEHDIEASRVFCMADVLMFECFVYDR